MLSAPLVGGPILVAVAVAFGWFAWGLRGSTGRPGGRGLVGVVALLSVVSLAEAIVVGAGLSPPLLHPLTQIAVFGATVCWASFVIAYTGRGDSSRVVFWLVAAVPAIGLFGAMLRLSPVLALEPEFESIGVVYLLLSGTPTVVSFGLLVGLSILLVWDATRYASFERSRGVALALIGASLAAAPMVTSTLETGDAISVPTGAVATQVTLLAAVAVGVGVGRPYRSLPIAEAIGRDAVVSNLNDAVVVVDDGARIVDMNPAAEDVFDRSLDAVVREPLTALFDEEALGPSGLPTESATTVAGPTGNRHYDVSVSRVSRESEAGGYAVALRDVTDERIRRQRLEVLDRVLRHNVRNDMTAVYAMADAVEADGNDRIARRLRETADSLVDVSERARTVEQSMEIDPGSDGETDVGAVASDVAAALCEQGHDVSVSVSGDAAVRRSAELVGAAAEHLLSCATRGVDAPVAARVERDGDHVVLAAESDEQFVCEQALSAVAAGEETQLEHANDLDIWAVSWVADRLGGELDLDREDGTRMAVRIPVA